METLRDLLEIELQDLYSAENQILDALPAMAETASDEKLKKAFEKHFKETETHVARLEEVGEKLEIELEGKECKGMEGLLKEGEELLGEDPSPVLDQALIGAAQRVERYEMAGYGCVITHAELLGYKDAVKLLKETIAEEEKTDEDLTKIAQQELKTLEE